MKPVRLPLTVRLTRSIVMAFVIAQWCGWVLRTARFDVVLVITFAWSATTARRWLAAERREAAPELRWSLDLVLTLLAWQYVWAGVSWLRFALPNAWFWLPIDVPLQLSWAAAALAVYWPLQPFYHRWKRALPIRASALNPDLDFPLLGCCFFMLSGSLVFAALTLASIVHGIGTDPMRARLIRTSPQTVAPLQEA